MDKVLVVLKSLWANHKVKILSFIIGLLLSVLAAVTGVPLDSIKQAAREAAQESVVPTAVDPMPMLPEAPKDK